MKVNAGIPRAFDVTLQPTFSQYKEIKVGGIKTIDVMSRGWARQIRGCPKTFRSLTWPREQAIYSWAGKQAQPASNIIKMDTFQGSEGKDRFYTLVCLLFALILTQ